MTAVVEKTAAPPTPSTSVLALDPRRMRVGDEGVTPFYWPVGVDEIIALRDRFLVGLFRWLREEDIDRNRDAESLWLIAPQAVIAVMRLFQAYALQRRSQAAGYRLSEAEAESLFTRVAAGLDHEPSPLARVLNRGLAEDPTWRKLVRLLKGGYRTKGLRYRPRQLLRPERDIVTFSASDLLVAHARRTQQTVYLSKFDEWLTPGRIPESELPEAFGADAKAAFLEIVEEAFRAGGESLSDALARNLCMEIDGLSRRVAFYLSELRRDEAALPRHLWLGSAGIIYNRIMARAVQTAGGDAVGHDHGTGCGWWQTYYQTLSELNYVDRFVTYSDAMAEGVRRNLRTDLLAKAEPERRIDSITGLGRSTGPERPSRAAPSVNSPRTRRSGEGKTAMYVATIYVSDGMHMLPLHADLVAVDWQARLFAFLKNEGYQIVFKPHPESRSEAPQAFRDRFGMKVLEQRFEEVVEQADVLIFDYLQTSALVGALNSDRSIVLIEFPRLRLDPEARRLLAGRAAFVEGRIGEDGRAEVDWGELRQALDVSSSLTDDGFIERYYPAH